MTKTIYKVKVLFFFKENTSQCTIHVPYTHNWGSVVYTCTCNSDFFYLLSCKIWKSVKLFIAKKVKPCILSFRFFRRRFESAARNDCSSAHGPLSSRPCPIRNRSKIRTQHGSSGSIDLAVQVLRRWRWRHEWDGQWRTFQ